MEKECEIIHGGTGISRSAGYQTCHNRYRYQAGYRYRIQKRPDYPIPINSTVVTIRRSGNQSFRYYLALHDPVAGAAVVGRVQILVIRGTGQIIIAVLLPTLLRLLLLSLLLFLLLLLLVVGSAVIVILNVVVIVLVVAVVFGVRLGRVVGAALRVHLLGGGGGGEEGGTVAVHLYEHCTNVT